MKHIIGEKYINHLILVILKLGDFFMNSFWINNFKSKSYPTLDKDLNVASRFEPSQLFDIETNSFITI